ncbi:hypothetical protein HF086_003606 [Spodoptera exigua]|uniref:Uncharacterized protein n=2 Tax=Spodoptera exigua TaxID=7107 RepID=A0A922MMP1_SPOEX|nr:hypothetical protein HF086_003606 [Spodoptera exigua]
MAYSCGLLYHTILFFISITLQNTHCSPSTPFGLQPVFLPEDMDDETYAALIFQRPDMEPYLSAQRKAQLRRRMTMGNSDYENDEEDQVLLVENDDDDMTRPLSDFEDGRKTELVNPALVPESSYYGESNQGRSLIGKKEKMINNTRRQILNIFKTHETIAWGDAWLVANCYVCYQNWRGHEIPVLHLCHTGFHSNNWKYKTTGRFFRSVCYYNWDYRNSGFWKYKRYLWQGAYKYPGTRGLTLHRLGGYIRGCSKRYADVGEVFTVRGCRGWWPHYIGYLMEGRQIRLELPITRLENETCRIAHHATLTPFHRGISLFARFRACVCFGRYCNNAVANDIHIPLLLFGYIFVHNEIKLYL